MKKTLMRSVAVFDAGLSPGIAFIRSLGSRGVPVTVYSATSRPAGRFSRFAAAFRTCPDLGDADEFVEWLTGEFGQQRIDLVAPTSDRIAFASAVAIGRSGLGSEDGSTSQAVLDCLLKSRFIGAMADVGFPTPPSRLPTSSDAAVRDARDIGYPVVLKPRSHVGVGLDRGTIVKSDDEMVERFKPYAIPDGQQCILAIDPELAYPLVQKYLDPARTRVVSVTGCLGPDGELLALGFNRKTHQWPPRLGVGTMFEVVPEPPFAERAVAAVRDVLGAGIFELEVLVEDDDKCWAIDLNPRAFGQVSLDIALGRDLPVIWYRSVTGIEIAGRQPKRSPPVAWQQGVPYYAGYAVRLALGPARSQHARLFLEHLRTPKVGATMSWSDPIPALVTSYAFVRHPGGLLRPYVRER